MKRAITYGAVPPILVGGILIGIIDATQAVRYYTHFAIFDYNAIWGAVSSLCLALLAVTHFNKKACVVMCILFGIVVWIGCFACVILSQGLLLKGLTIVKAVIFCDLGVVLIRALSSNKI